MQNVARVIFLMCVCRRNVSTHEKVDSISTIIPEEPPLCDVTMGTVFSVIAGWQTHPWQGTDSAPLGKPCFYTKHVEGPAKPQY